MDGDFFYIAVSLTTKKFENESDTSSVAKPFMGNMLASALITIIKMKVASTEIVTFLFIIEIKVVIHCDNVTKIQRK